MVKNINRRWMALMIDQMRAKVASRMTQLSFSMKNRLIMIVVNCYIKGILQITDTSSFVKVLIEVRCSSLSKRCLFRFGFETDLGLCLGIDHAILGTF